MAVVRPGLERRLRAEITGDVSFDPFTRGLAAALAGIPLEELRPYRAAAE